MDCYCTYLPFFFLYKRHELCELCEKKGLAARLRFQIVSAGSPPVALRNYGTFVPFHLFKIYLEAMPCEKPYFCDTNEW